MSSVIYWVFDYNGTNHYQFPRNPDRYGGDTYWSYEMRYSEMDVIGSATPTVQYGGFRGATRTIRFTAITGSMMRTLQKFYMRGSTVSHCRDHLYESEVSPEFSCLVIDFRPEIHPTMGNFPGSGEDTFDLEMTLMRVFEG